MKHLKSYFNSIDVSPSSLSEIQQYNYHQTPLFHGFFIDTDVFGKLHETDNPEKFVLINKKNIYIISSPHEYALILNHYISSLEHDIKRFTEYSRMHQVEYSQEIINTQKQLINLFQKQCENFLTDYPKGQFESYTYIMRLRQLINIYAGVRTSVLGSAESLYDSKKSNNFLLLGISDLNLSSYFRVDTWLIEDQKKYISHILNFPHKDTYDIHLTSAGMKAITLAIEWTLSQNRKKVLVIGIGYFETMNMLENYFSQEDIIYFNPYDSSNNFGDFIKKYQPDVIFVDSVSLSFYPYIFGKKEFGNLVSELQKQSCNASIIIDASTKYIFLQDYEIPGDCNNEIFFVGSIGKYLYGGMDLGFSGYILAPKKLQKLKTVFANSGVCVSNIDALKIPLFSLRTHRLLAKKISNNIQDIKNIWEEKTQNSQITSVLFPKIEENNFYSNIINIGYIDGEKQEMIINKHKEKIVTKIMQIAKKQNLDVSYSTSYGFYNTRFSIFMRSLLETVPSEHRAYIRISVGYQSFPDDVVKFMQIVVRVLHALDT